MPKRPLSAPLSSAEWRLAIRAGEEWRGWRAGKVLVVDDGWDHEILFRTGEALKAEEEDADVEAWRVLLVVDVDQPSGGECAPVR